MALKTNVLLFHVSTLHEARYGAGMGVEIISLPVGTGQKAVDEVSFAEIKGWLEGVKVYAEITDAALAENLPADGFIVSDAALATSLSGSQKAVGLLIEADSLSAIKNRLEAAKGQVAFSVVSNPAISPEELKELTDAHDIYINTAFTQENIHTFIDQASPKGLAFTGAEEIKTGLNDFDELADLLEAIDTDEFA